MGFKLVLLAVLVCLAAADDLYFHGQTYEDLADKQSSDPEWPTLVQSVIDQCVADHNQKRALHGLPGLTNIISFNADAQNWAEHLQQLGYMVHDQQTPQGQNLYYSQAGVLSFYQPWRWWFESNGDTLNEIPLCAAVQAWYDEIQDYDYNNPGFSSGTGHFTQVVWAAATQLGVGISVKRIASSNPGQQSDFLKVFIVARYDPAGNFLGQFATQVPPLV